MSVLGTKVSGFTALGSVSGDEIFGVVDGGANYRVTTSEILTAGLDADFGALTASGDFTVATDVFDVDSTNESVAVGGSAGLGAKLDVKDDGFGGTRILRLTQDDANPWLLALRNLTYSASDAVNGYVDNSGNFLLGTAGAKQLRFYYNAGFASPILVVGANVGINATSFGTSAAGVLGIKNGTAPGSSPADMVHLWAEDVSSSSELRVRDEAGNVTTLSPHSDPLFPLDPNEDLFWNHRAVNVFTGIEAHIDMIGMIRAVEALTLQQFIYTQDLPPAEKEDWDANEQAKFVQSATKIAEWDAKEAEIAAWDALSDEVKEGSERPLLPSPTRPDAYVTKEPPAYIKQVLDKQEASPK